MQACIRVHFHSDNPLRLPIGQFIHCPAMIKMALLFEHLSSELIQPAAMLLMYWQRM